MNGKSFLPPPHAWCWAVYGVHDICNCKAGSVTCVIGVRFPLVNNRQVWGGRSRPTSSTKGRSVSSCYLSGANNQKEWPENCYNKFSKQVCFFPTKLFTKSPGFPISFLNTNPGALLLLVSMKSPFPYSKFYAGTATERPGHHVCSLQLLPDPVTTMTFDPSPFLCLTRNLPGGSQSRHCGPHYPNVEWMLWN